MITKPSAPSWCYNRDPNIKALKRKYITVDGADLAPFGLLRNALTS